MATSLGHSKMKRMESRKSHSWWWDSHISPKNSKWLAENLEEMDQSVKRMLKLIEEDADSFAKKAEMYYQKRPELISHVEEFYRMYRSLAERYDHVTGELRKNIPSDLQSQGSGVSDISSELPSTCPSPDQRPGRRKSGPRAAGFDFFLGSAGGSTEFYQKGVDESSSISDSETESDCSSVNNYSGFVGNGGDQGLQKKIVELEIELQEAKERLRLQEERNADGSIKGVKNENTDALLARIAGYGQDVRLANEKLQLSNEEISRLKIELQKYNSSESSDHLQAVIGSEPQEGINGLETQTLDPDTKVLALTEELRITKEKLQLSEAEIASLKHELETNRSEKIQALQNQLHLAQKDIGTWKSKLNSDRKEVSKLQERIKNLKTSLSDRDHEIRDLKIAVSDAEQKIFPEKAQINAEIAGLHNEKACLEEQLREWESRGRSLEDELRIIETKKTELEEKLRGEIERLKASIAERDDDIENLKGSLDSLKTERDVLKSDVISRDDRIDQKEKHLLQLHMEHMELIVGAEEARKLVGELRLKAKELEDETEKQRVVILEGAEEKREAIRQLCFSLEHYRSSYISLRKAFTGHKRVAVLAS